MKLAFSALCLLGLVAYQPEQAETSRQLQIGPYAIRMREKVVATDFGDAWGVLGDKSRVITRLRMSCNGKRVFVPRSAYADLANVHSFRGKRTKKGCVIQMEGGDAGEGYDAEITIRGEDVVAREVHSGEFPEYHFEKTVYSNVAPPD